MFLAGEISRQRHDRRRHCAAALQGPAQNYAVNRIGQRCYDAAHSENQQADIDHPLAPVMIGQKPERNLEERLTEAVDADSQTRQRRGVAAQMFGVQCEHRQNHEQAQHPQREYPRQPERRPAFAGGHPLTG